MKAVITGITGFAGSHLAETLLAWGDQVLGLSRNAHWPDHLPATLTDAIELVPWDIRQPPSPQLQDQLAQWQPDCCYHLAAISIPADCGRTDPTQAAIECNINGTQHVLDLLNKLPQPARLLFTSSNHVYATVTPENAIVAEDAAVDPESAYGKTKLAAETLVQQAVQDQQLNAFIVRSFQHTGPRQQPRMMVPEWARQFAQPTGTIQVRNLDTYLDLSDVRDVVEAYRCLMDTATTGSIFNIGTGMAIGSGQVCEYFQQLMPEPRTVQETSPGRRQHPIADITKLQQTIDWQPKIELAQTVQDTLNYWIQRPDPLDS